MYAYDDETIQVTNGQLFGAFVYVMKKIDPVAKIDDLKAAERSQLVEMAAYLLHEIAEQYNVEIERVMSIFLETYPEMNPKSQIRTEHEMVREAMLMTVRYYTEPDGETTTEAEVEEVNRIMDHPEDYPYEFANIRQMWSFYINRWNRWNASGLSETEFMEQEEIRFQMKSIDDDIEANMY